VKEAVEAVRNAARLPFKQGLVEERAVFQRLRESEEAAALRYLFFAQRDAARVSGIENQAAARAPRWSGGAGLMGSGIAVVFDAGHAVTLVERTRRRSMPGWIASARSIAGRSRPDA
jgi:3-hydroxyacyl-CoA dehydrogenase